MDDEVMDYVWQIKWYIDGLLEYMEWHEREVESMKYEKKYLWNKNYNIMCGMRYSIWWTNMLCTIGLCCDW